MAPRRKNNLKTRPVLPGFRCMRTVLVTGGTGFIGRNCLSRLLQRGFQVHAVSRRSGDRSALPNISWHQIDLNDFAQVRELVEQIRPDYLLHFAWVVEPGLFWDSSENLSCVSSSLHLLRCFAECG